MSDLSSQEPSTESGGRQAEEVASLQLQLMELEVEIAADGVDFPMRQLFDTMLQTANTLTPEKKIAQLGQMIMMLKRLITGHKERAAKKLESPAPASACSGMLQHSRRVRSSEGTGMFSGVVGSADETDGPVAAQPAAETDGPVVVQPPSRSSIRPALLARVEAFVKFAVPHVRQQLQADQPANIDAVSLVADYNAAHPHLPPADCATLTFFRHHLVSMSRHV